MELTGKAVGASLDFDTNHFCITFEVNESDVVKREYDKLKQYDKLKIKAVRYTQRRSLDANAYFHVLVGKIADVLTISKAKAKNVLICKYGQPQLLPDGNIMVYKTNAPEEFMWEQEAIHCIPVKYDGNATFYKVYRGSHTYDTKEMSILIDGTVADAKELGIETATPAELQEMKERWGARRNFGVYSQMIWTIAILLGMLPLNVIISLEDVTGRIVRSMVLLYHSGRICIRTVHWQERMLQRLI